MSAEYQARARHWRRRLTVTIAVIGLILGMVTPALAIVYGEPDGSDHPYVGAIVLDVPDEGLFEWCSGTLIASKVFLTASHCTAPLDQFIEENPGTEVLVTFDPVISENGTFFTGTWITNPNYNGFSGPGGSSDPGDVAVILLDQAPGISPASLPPAGMLDELKAEHVLDDTLFTAVGYGAVRESRVGGFQGILDNAERRRAEQSFLSLTKAWLTLSMNEATGSGGDLLRRLRRAALHPSGRPGNENRRFDHRHRRRCLQGDR